MTARIIRIILPADTTVTVGDTLWWGVEGVCIHEPHDHPPDHFDPAGCDTVPPEWQALTEACATCGDDFGWAPGWRSTEPFAETPERCPDCHEGRRTVEVVAICWNCHDDDGAADGLIEVGPCEDYPVAQLLPCDVCGDIDHRGSGQVSLGRAVTDGDWVPILSSIDPRFIEDEMYPCFVVEGFTGDVSYWVGPDEDDINTDITLHGHTAPGGYAARFEIVEVPSS